VARSRIERLRGWMTARMQGEAQGPPPADLLGLGPGLTPSGDDLLCGALVALRAVAQESVARELYAEIASVGPAATCPLSGAFLAAAGEGLAAEPLHAAIAAMLQARNEAAASHVEALGGIGHTSGWDALAGALLTLQALGTTAVQWAGSHGPG
jgi:hypothetical protein